MLTRTLLRRLHRWIGLACSLTLLLASGSGLLHLASGGHHAAPVPASEGLDLSTVTCSPAQLMAGLEPGLRPAALHLRPVHGVLYYQVMPPTGVPRYFSVGDGAAVPKFDPVYAEALARHHLALPPETPLRVAALLTAYDREYTAFQRVLPVYRVELDDARHTRLYVSTATASVVRQTDDRTELTTELFRQGHFLTFIPHPGLRRALLWSANMLAFLAAAGGVWLFLATRRRGRDWRSAC